MCSPAGSEVASVKSIAINGRVVVSAASGDNVDVAIGGVEENVLRPGQILCWPSHPVPHIIKFKARIATFPTLDIPLVPGQQFVLHSHTLEEPCNVTMLLRTINKEGHTDVIKPRCLTAGVVAIVRIKMTREVCLDTFASHKRLGRFMLRYGENTVAAGMILKLKPLARHGGTS
jgi:elongation factor 1 alpha-like protein